MLFARTLIIAVSITLAIPAGAGIIDLSKPETGKSRFVFNLDGTPVDIGPSKIGSPTTAISQGDREAPQRMRSTKATDKDKESTIKSRRGAAVVIVNREGRTNGADRNEPRTAPRIRFGRRR